MRKKVFMWLLVGLSIGSTLSAHGQITTDWDRTTDFTMYKTYSWLKAEGGDSLWSDRLQQDVDAQLAAKGWTKVPVNGNATVMAFRRTTSEQTLETFYDGFGGGWRWRGFGDTGIATTTPETIKVGNIIVDIFDGGTHKLIWRSKDTGDLSGNVDRNIEMLQRDVQKMFRKFPPG